jgi:hypothetical protein
MMLEEAACLLTARYRATIKKTYQTGVGSQG